MRENVVVDATTERKDAVPYFPSGLALPQELSRIAEFRDGYRQYSTQQTEYTHDGFWT